MKSTPKDRLMDFIVYLGVSMNEFEKNCGFSTRYLCNVRSPGAAKLSQVKAAYPSLNMEWVMNGTGSMLVAEESSANDCPEQTNAAPSGRKPVLPSEITCHADTDLYDYVAQNAQGLEKSSIIVTDLPIDMWYTVRDDSLYPEAKRGDSIALASYPKGKVDLIPGALYAVNTRSNGLIVRRLQKTKKGYLAIAPNKENYPDMTLLPSNIIRIFRVVFLGRLAV